MKVYRGLERFEKNNNTIVTIGTYDGVHLGHQKILSRLNEIAAAEKGESLVLTLWPHPKMVLFPDNHNTKLLTTLDEKTALLSEKGIDNLVIAEFTNAFSQLSARQFVEKVLVEKLGTKKLVIGYDHHFGNNREGNLEFLKSVAPEYHFEIEEIPKQTVDENAISSTKIREALQKGDVATACRYLGRYYAINGKVKKGRQLGKTIGYPTANIEVPENYKLIPAEGIYATEVFYQGTKYYGMMSIGWNPTVSGNEKTIEVNIFDFDKEIYGESLTINFVEKLREEEKFENLDGLITQLKHDKADTCRIFNIQTSH